ncbi:MAG: capsular polysaccharide biosynthesis protein, partial [Pseudomonadota bacterium]
MERLSAYSLTLLTQPSLRRLIAATGSRIVAPWATADAVAVWGRKRAAQRGMAAARRQGLPVVSFEDAPLRGLRPGVGPGWGCVRDRTGIYFDCHAPSDLEILLNSPRPVSSEATNALALVRHYRLSKYNGWSDVTLPDAPF